MAPELVAEAGHLELLIKALLWQRLGIQLMIIAHLLCPERSRVKPAGVLRTILSGGMC